MLNILAKEWGKIAKVTRWVNTYIPDFLFQTKSSRWTFNTYEYILDKRQVLLCALTNGHDYHLLTTKTGFIPQTFQVFQSYTHTHIHRYSRSRFKKSIYHCTHSVGLRGQEFGKRIFRRFHPTNMYIYIYPSSFGDNLLLSLFDI